MTTQMALRTNNPDAQATLWIGVDRAEFGEELEDQTQWGVSPWRYFLWHFCDIADAALLRVLKERREAQQSERMVELERFATVRVVTGNTLHALTRMTKELTGPIRGLEFAAQKRLLDDELKGMIFGLQPTCDRIRDKLTLLRKALSENDLRPCDLDTAIQQVCDSVEDSCLQEGIKIVRPRATGYRIDVPFHAAVFAFETILHNGRDAIMTIANGNPAEHRISIEVSDQPREVICTVADTGPGIPEHLRPIITHKPTDSTKSDGNGVGLYLSSFLLRGYRSDIILEPTTGKGAVFSIRFRKPELKK